MAWEARGLAILREDSILQVHSILAHIISRFTTTGIIFVTTETTFSIIITSLTIASSSGSVTRFMAYPYYDYPYDYGYYDYSGEAYNNQYWSDLTGAVQTELARDGYYRGAIDGVFGPDTARAIRAYRRAKGLPVTGQIDRTLLKSLDI